MENNYFEKYLVEQIRLQRHDFMNYLQVIYGYIQINKPTEAINYIKNINKYMVVLSKIFNLECDALGMFFQEFINKCSKFNIEVELDLNIEYISYEHFSKDIEKKKILFDFVTDKLIEEVNSLKDECQKLYIYIGGSAEDFNIIISSLKKINNENFYNFMDSIYHSHGIEGEVEHYTFYRNNKVAALLLNYN